MLQNRPQKDVFNQNIFYFENFRLVRLNEQKMKETKEREIKDDLQSECLNSA